MQTFPHCMSIVTLLIAYIAPCLPWFRHWRFLDLRYQGCTQTPGLWLGIEESLTPEKLQSKLGRKIVTTCSVRVIILVVMPIIWKSIISCDGYHISNVVNWLTRGIECNDSPSGIKDWQSRVCEHKCFHDGGSSGEVEFTQQWGYAGKQTSEKIIWFKKQRRRIMLKNR